MKTEVPIDQEIMDLVPSFVNSLHRDLVRLKDLQSKNQFKDVKRIGHNIKGVARPYGFPTLETLALDLEQAAESGDQIKVGSLLEQFEDYLSVYAPSIS